MWFGGKAKGSACGDVPHRLASLAVVALISANLAQHCLLRIFSYAISGPYFKGTCPVTCVLGSLSKEKEDGCIMSPPSPSIHLEFSALPFHVRSVAPLLLQQCLQAPQHQTKATQPPSILSAQPSRLGLMVTRAIFRPGLPGLVVSGDIVLHIPGRLGTRSEAEGNLELLVLLSHSLPAQGL